MTGSLFYLKRLRIMKKGKAVYDQSFHLGVNIIHGQNGSGKSTIADAIFYALGGKFDNWKTEAAQCDEVQAEVATKTGVLTIRRAISSADAPVQVFFGPFEDSDSHALDGWETLPLKRSERKESFSQIMFRASGIPEAQSEGASNVTMHQILRLLYSDQRTPAAFLFRYESFDTAEIREAVGELLCGITGYEQLEIELKLRELRKTLQDHKRRLAALLEAFSASTELVEVAAIDQNLKVKRDEYEKVSSQISRAKQGDETPEVSEFVKARTAAADGIRKLNKKLEKAEEKAKLDQLEHAELSKFIEYLEALLNKVGKSDAASEIVGSIEFSHCPVCLGALKSGDGSGCALCGQAIDPEREQSRYLQIKLDIEIQLRESKQLLTERDSEISRGEKKLRELRSSYRESVSEFNVRYELSGTPQDSYLAARYQRLGQIDRELTHLNTLREVALEIEFKRSEASKIEGEVGRLEARNSALEASTRKRRSIALTAISEQARRILKADLPRQVEFQHAKNVTLNFRDNSVLVDDQLNFAESSNVIAKNAAVLGLFLAGLEDEEFFHPKFLLLDNIEDKGMEQERSHNFQKLIVRLSGGSEVPHQIIFTTSMLSPELDSKTYVIGERYSHQNRTLKL